MSFRSSLTIALICTSVFIFAQEKEKPKWDVTNPSGPHKDVSFTVSEGTWMNLDISPDGNEILFDLLGDIYSIPSVGGTAKILRGGLAFEVQPRFSPDGKKILFTSDAGGGDNCWVMNRDGSDAKQITKENFRLLNNGVWSPDGQYIVARKHFTSQRSLGAGELWIYHISGGTGLQLTPKKNEQQDLNEPCYSPDGKYVYYSEDMYPGGVFSYNKDPNNQIFVVRRYDIEKGTSETVTGGGGGAFRPQISHDGKLLAFVKRVRTQTVLYLRNLETGEEWPVYDHLSKDQQEAWTIFGIYTGFAWSPDDQHIYIWANGKINKVAVTGFDQSTDIPFTCNVNQRIYDAVRFKQTLNQDSLSVHVIRQATTSPDGKMLVFNAVGYLWKKSLPDGKPMRLTSGTDFEFEPSFSPDGKTLIYTTWNDANAGSIYKINLQDGNNPVKISASKAIYRHPSFSPDGKQIVLEKEGGSNAMGPAFTSKPGIYIMPAAGGDATFVTNKGSNPQFNATNDRIYYQSDGEGTATNLYSCKLDGSDDRTLLKSTYGSQFTVSPDDKWIAFIDLHKAYIAAFLHTGKTIDLGSGTTDFPVKQVSKDAGFNLHWSSDSKQLQYTLGSQYFTIDLSDRFEFIAGVADSLFKMPEQGIEAGLKVLMDKPKGLIAFTNARIITMKGNEVIEKGTVLVEDNMIKGIGKNVSIPSSAKVINCSGKTIMPGIIDAHAHGNHFYSGMAPQQFWPYYVNLAFGVTTMHDPSANTEWVFGQSELQKSGAITGPRVFSTGTILYGADGNFKAVINSLEDAESAIRRTKAFGAFSVKSYNQPRREQRQMVIAAARELGMEVVPEGGSFFYHNLSMILDGHTTIEHNLPIVPLYSDVINLWKNSNTAYTPTLIVSYGAVSGEYYWYQHSNVWENRRLSMFTPRSVIDTRGRYRTMLPEEEYENGYQLVSKQVTKLNNAGVKINLGAHGQLQGLGAHWELWMLQQGGMSNHDALKAATINPAQSLGLDDWIGSLETGKLADLIVLDKNPLDNIRNSESIKYTMVNGHLYDAMTLNEIGNNNKSRSKFFWELSKNAAFFPYSGETDEVNKGCMCGKH